MAKHEGSELLRGNVLLLDHIQEDDPDEIIEVAPYEYLGRHRVSASRAPDPRP